MKVTVVLARPDLDKEMNEAYAEFFQGRSRPGRWFASGLIFPAGLVAIEAIALA